MRRRALGMIVLSTLAASACADDRGIGGDDVAPVKTVAAIEVPDVVGQTAPAAREVLREADLRMRIDRRGSSAPKNGVVAEQRPSPGTPVTAATVVEVKTTRPRR